MPVSLIIQDFYGVKKMDITVSTVPEDRKEQSYTGSENTYHEPYPNHFFLAVLQSLEPEITELTSLHECARSIVIYAHFLAVIR